MKFFFSALALTLCAEAAAQELYKCKDAAGKITYSGKECNLLGLSPAGEVTGRITVTPALKAPPPPPVQPARPAAAAKDEASKSQGTAAAKDAPPPAPPPERRCFTVQTAKGAATRCNDVPPE